MNSTNSTETNQHNHCSDDLPRTEEFFQSLRVAEKSLLTLSGLLSLATATLYINNVIFILRKHTTDKQIKYKSIQVLAVFPVVSLSSLVSLCIPRAAVVNQCIYSVYVAGAMLGFVTLMTLYCGGKQRMLTRLEKFRIQMRAPPCCCCCYCLHSLPVISKNVRCIKILVLQHALVQPVATLLAVVLWMDGKYTEGLISVKNSFPYLTVVNVVSMLLGLYGFFLFYNMCKEYLRPVAIIPKFLLLKVVVVLPRLLGGIFSVLAKFDIPACEGILSSTVKCQAYLQMIVIGTMFVLMLLAIRFYCRPLDHIEALSTNTDAVPEIDSYDQVDKKNGDQVKNALMLEDDKQLSIGPLPSPATSHRSPASFFPVPPSPFWLPTGDYGAMSVFVVLVAVCLVAKKRICELPEASKLIQHFINPVLPASGTSPT